MLASVLSGLLMVSVEKIEYTVQNSLRSDMLHAYLNTDESTQSNYTSDELLNRINYDLPLSTQLIGLLMSGGIYQPIISGICSELILLYIDWRIAILCFACAVLTMICTSLFSRKLESLNKSISEEKSELISCIQEGINGAAEVRIFNIQHLLLQKCRDLIRRINKINTKIYFYRGVRYSAVTLTADCITVLAILVLGSVLSQKGIVIFSNVMLAIPLSDQIAQMITSIGMINTLKKEYTGNVQRVFEIIELEPKQISSNYQYVSAEHPEICFDHVCFGYDDTPVLKDVSFTVNRGNKIAFIGESGSGKSTIVKLLLHLLDPSAGNIYIRDGVEMAYMPQETYMYHITVGENISFDKSFDEKKVKKAAKLACADSFIESRPSSYHYKMKDINKTFSGGQQQRISLARTLYQDKDVLIFDEPTSSLDQKTVNIIRKMFAEIKEKTVIVVTHNRDIVKDFDCVYKVDACQVKLVEDRKR